MAKFIEKVRKGDMIDIGGSKKIVTEVYPYIIRMIDPSTGTMSTASVGDLVIAGLETSGPSVSLKPRYNQHFR